MGKMSRTKGRVAEREVELLFQAEGFDTDRNIGGRLQKADDIAATRGDLILEIEVRRREALQVEKWVHERENPRRILVTRTSRNPWMAAMPLTTLFDLLNRATQQEGHK